MSCSIKSTILSMDRAVPRYTSYPTAPHFKALEDAGVYCGWLEDVRDDARLSLYVHIPFCSSICWYCGCHTKATKRYEPVHSYVGYVLKEIDLLANRLGQRHKVHHIHFGGGSPSILEPDDFRDIMARLDERFDIDYENGEIAVEIDPRGMDETKIEAYARAGVNRVSLGVQDTHNKTLEAINRVQPFELSLKAAQLFRENGIENLSVDLLYGLPYQTVESMAETIERVMALSPDRLSLFGYAHVPWMKKHMLLIDEDSLPGNELRYDLFHEGEKSLIAHGYVPVGIDHFAKGTDSLALCKTLHRNFQGYTTDSADALLGIGASSISKLPQGYVQNAVDMPIYQDAVNSGILPVRKFCVLTPEDRLRGDIIERLMCDFKVDIPAICRAHGFAENHFDSVLTNLSTFMKRNMLVISAEKTLTILPHARLVARLICAEFDEHFSCAPEKPRHAKAV